jgi:hypothetical protein
MSPRQLYTEIRAAAMLRRGIKCRPGMGTALSFVIALCSAGFTGMQWWDARSKFVLSAKPHVDFEMDDDPDEPLVDIAITNAGPGAAVIKSIRWIANRCAT